MAEKRPIPGFPGYEADSQGRIWTTNGNRRGFPARVLKEHPNTHGYPTVRVYVDLKCKRKPVHSLVALAFLGPKPEGAEVRHLDGHQHHNWPGNLAYGTAKANAGDRETHGRTFKQRGRAGRFANEG